ncbi:twin-arginine translocation signal domain-containing protein [Streptomyces sp. ALI-76-A]|uniref:twin-arginine translocation signal domain-containing protein n=1 Tax=Streptomyces sp. ALI-76-A TaxID=3025736 RepID=UPI003365001B
MSQHSRRSVLKSGGVAAAAVMVPLQGAECACPTATARPPPAGSRVTGGPVRPGPRKQRGYAERMSGRPTDGHGHRGQVCDSRLVPP